MQGMEDLPRTLGGSSEEGQPTELDARLTAPPGRDARARRAAYSALRPPGAAARARWVRSPLASLAAPVARRRSVAAGRDPAPQVGESRFYGHTKGDLYERARGLGIPGRASMSKRELARAIAERQSAA